MGLWLKNIKGIHAKKIVLDISCDDIFGINLIQSCLPSGDTFWNTDAIIKIQIIDLKSKIL